MTNTRPKVDVKRSEIAQNRELIAKFQQILAPEVIFEQFLSLYLFLDEKQGQNCSIRFPKRAKQESEFQTLPKTRDYTNPNPAPLEPCPRGCFVSPANALHGRGPGGMVAAARGTGLARVFHSHRYGAGPGLPRRQGSPAAPGGSDSPGPIPPTARGRGLLRTDP